MERLRADELPAYTVARDVTCCPPCPDQYGCARCKGTGRVPCEPLDLLRLLAFLGVEEARKACGGSPRYYELEGELPLPQWIGSLTSGLNGRGFGLSSILSKLPPHRLEVACANCRHGVVSLGPRCRRCRVSDTPAERWLMVVAALAVARKCWECHDLPYCSDLRTRIEDALLDAQAWVEEPTRERERAWQGRSDDWNGIPAWVPSPHSWAGIGPTAAETLQAAAAVIGEPRVREVVTAALLGRLL